MSGPPQVRGAAVRLRGAGLRWFNPRDRFPRHLLLQSNVWVGGSCPRCPGVRRLHGPPPRRRATATELAPSNPRRTGTTLSPPKQRGTEPAPALRQSKSDGACAGPTQIRGGQRPRRPLSIGRGTVIAAP